MIKKEEGIMSYVKVGPNKYRVFISDGTNLDGTRRRFSKTVTTDLKGRDLKRFLLEEEFKFEDEIKRKDPKFYHLSRGTFEEYSAWWLGYRKLAAKTRNEYKKLLNGRINKYIGKKILDSITANDLIELMKLIEESPAQTPTGKLSATSVNHYHTLLKIMFNDAHKLKIIRENPMELVPTSQPNHKLKDNYYDLDDVRGLLEVLPRESTKYQLITHLALVTGARLGELTALQWKHIDCDNLQIKIEQSNSYVEGKGTQIKSTKNTHSERTVAYPQSLNDLIDKHKEEELLKKEALQEKWEGSPEHLEDFVFTQSNGKVMHVGTPSKWFNRFIRKNNLKKITFHGLRHTNTTILIHSGINVVSISHSLGHSNTSTTTDIYAHHLESVERKIADTFDDIITGSESGSQTRKLRVVK